MEKELLKNIEKIQTTELGIERIKKNLELDTKDVVEWCKQKVKLSDNIIKKGKYWYVSIENSIITINVKSFTIITAHKILKNIKEYK